MSKIVDNILEIEFLTLTQKPIINKIQFLGETKKVNSGKSIIFTINKSFYDENETKCVSLTLFKDNEEINQCIFELFMGYNHCYCFLDEKGYTIELLLKYLNDVNESIVRISSPIKYEFTKFDTNGTKFRKRYVFANFSQFLLDINNTTYNIPSILKEINSYQLSVYDIEKKLTVYKKLTLEKFDDILFKNKYQQYGKKANDFRIKLNSLVQMDQKKNNKFVEKLKQLMEDNKELSEIKFFLNENYSKLENILDDENYIDFYINFNLYNIILSMDYDLKQIKKMVLFIETTAKKITTDNIKIYQKILILSQFLDLASSCKKEKDLKDANFTYYIMTNKDEDSILDFVDKFFKEYSKLLTEESPVFNKLLEIDSGLGIYNNESFFCYSMQNVEEIKKHLEEISTSIFITYVDHNKKKKPKLTLAYTTYNTGMISVNTHKLKLIQSGQPLDKKIQDKNKIEEAKDDAAKIIYYLLHEVNGHKKYSYKTNNLNLSSPKYFIEKGNIYKLIMIDLNEKKKTKIFGEEGFFYELIYGKIGDFFTFEIVDILNNYGELLDEVDVWVNKIEIFKEFIKVKILKQIFGMNQKSKETSIEGKIKDYYKEIDQIIKDKDYCFKDIPGNIITRLLADRFIKIKGITSKTEVKTFSQINEKNNQIKGKFLKKGQKENEENDDSQISEENEEIEESENSEESQDSEVSEKSRKKKTLKRAMEDINFNDFSYEEIKKLKKSGVLTLDQLKKCNEREKNLMMKIRYSNNSK